MKNTASGGYRRIIGSYIADALSSVTNLTSVSMLDGMSSQYSSTYSLSTGSVRIDLLFVINSTLMHAKTYKIKTIRRKVYAIVPADDRSPRTSIQSALNCAKRRIVRARRASLSVRSTIKV